MARKRMIDPSFWVDEKLGTIEPRARLLFMGLISQADDEGRLNGHPSLIRSLIFPYDYDISLQDVDAWLVQMSDRKLIIRYEVDYQKYILITNFKKHQTINRPQPSKLPEPIIEHSLNDAGTFTDEQMTDHAQRKRKEEKLKEDETKEKGREETIPAPDSNPHKDYIHKLVNECKIESYTLYDLDEIFSYIGLVDIEIIEAAIKKGTGKQSIKYCISVLKGMVKDGITKKEQLFAKPTPGQAPNVTPFPKRSGKPQIEVIKDDPGERKQPTPEQLEELRALARKLDGA